MVRPSKHKSTTSYKETAFGILPRGRIILLEQRGVKKALEYIIACGEHKAEITPQLILDIHRTGFGHIFPEWAGEFRTEDVTVGTYEPPHFSRVPELVRNLCDDLRERLQHMPSPQTGELDPVLRTVG